MNKLTRFDKARARVHLDDIKIISADQQGRIKAAFVAGSQTRLYQVIIKRDGARIIGECLMEPAQDACKGSYNSACYHILAVALKSAIDNGLEVALCARSEDAQLLKRIKGKVYTVQSKHAQHNPVFMVVNDPNQDKNKGTNYYATT